MDRIRPLLFVAMPFGKRKDPTGSFEIDFDQIYQLAIRPAAEALDLEIIRADEERSGGIIHVPMFERLLLAEIVIADVTVPNPNVFYELGIRHAARPRSTVLIYAKGATLPFDIYMIRALPYHLDRGVLSDENATSLKLVLQEKLQTAKNDLETPDSPLFQLIRQYPGIKLSHEATESFRDRARYIDRMRNQLEAARSLPDTTEGLRLIEALETSLGDLNQTHSELIIDLLLSYRDINAWEKMISLYERLPVGPLREVATLKEQCALALNRRNANGDRERAVRLLTELVNNQGASSEALGILGRIFKDRYLEACQKGTGDQAAGFLDQSIENYRRGFEIDPRDYYPGINLATLLFIKGDDDATLELKLILPAVMFAVARRGGLKSSDFWDVATVMECAVLGEDWPIAKRSLQRLLSLCGKSWMYDTAANNLSLIRSAREGRGLLVEPVDLLINELMCVAR